MAGVLVGQGKPMCWNCDRERGPLVEAVIRAPSGRAATFSLCRPCYDAAYVPLASEAAERTPGKPAERTVLVVEDDPSTRWLLATIFGDEGFRVETAANGQEALRKARAHTPDAIVLDLLMPVMNGHDFVRAWRQTTPGPSVPILALSAHAPRATAEDLGVQAFLPKPFDLDALVGTVDGLLAPAWSRGRGAA